jgi:hypothetical protein
MRLVLCEGKDEVSVITGLCKASGLAGLTVEPFGGKDKLREVLAQLPKRPEFARKEVETVTSDRPEQRLHAFLTKAVQPASLDHREEPSPRSPGRQRGGILPQAAPRTLRAAGPDRSPEHGSELNVAISVAGMC